ncbi:hypothetical protein H0X09_00680 [Candidatus Saccharibacteria bacterium]|nr:hypothetical protein [Candidatus Saccharibacteria bacterium]
MTVSKPKQDEALFTVHEGAYGPVIKYPSSAEAPQKVEIRVMDQAELTARALGDFAVNKAPRAELETKHERFKEKFTQNPWVPRTQYEMTLALQGLPIAIGHIAEKMARRNQPTARNMYENAQKYYAQSSRALMELDDAFVLEGDKDPSIRRIRGEYPIRMMLAEYLLAKESFKELKWLPRKAGKVNPRELRLQVIMRDLEHRKPTEEVLQDWNEARQSAENAAEFWYGQLMSVQDNQRVEEIQREKLQP